MNNQKVFNMLASEKYRDVAQGLADKISRQLPKTPEGKLNSKIVSQALQDLNHDDLTIRMSAEEFLRGCGGWVSRLIDQAALIDLAKFPRPSGVTSSKLSESQVIAVRESSKPRKELAKDFDLSVSTVAKIQNRHIWRHLAG